MIGTSSRVHQGTFGRTKGGRDVTSYTLHAGGLRMEVLDYGAIVRSLYVPDRDGRLVDIVLGYDEMASYEDDRCYLGAAIGRYANRIRNGRFVLDGVTYQLADRHHRSDFVTSVAARYEHKLVSCRGST